VIVGVLPDRSERLKASYAAAIMPIESISLADLACTESHSEAAGINLGNFRLGKLLRNGPKFLLNPPNSGAGVLSIKRLSKKSQDLLAASSLP
jgi:hypothetical protein